MADTDGERMISARLDPDTARDLARLERHYRTGASTIIRMAIAEMARRLGLSEDELEGETAARTALAAVGSR